MYLTDDQTLKSESSFDEQMREPSVLPTMSATLSSTDASKQQIHALPDDVDCSSGHASGSRFEFLGSLAKSQTNEQGLDDASDKNKNETLQLEVETCLDEEHQGVSKQLMLSSATTESEALDRNFEKKMSADNVLADGQTPGETSCPAPTSSFLRHDDKTASSLLSPPKQQKVTKQNVPTATKKKKKRGIQPGREQSDLTLNQGMEHPNLTKSAETDSVSLSSHGSSSDVANTATSLVSMGMHAASDVHVLEESSAFDGGSRNRSIETTVVDGAATAKVSDDGQVRETAKENKSSHSDNESPDEQHEDSHNELSVDHEGRATTKDAIDTVFQPSHSSSKIVASLQHSATDLDSIKVFSAEKLLGDPGSVSSNPDLVVANYHVDLSADEKLTLLLEVIENKHNQLRLGNLMHL